MPLMYMHVIAWQKTYLTEWGYLVKYEKPECVRNTVCLAVQITFLKLIFY